MEVVGEKVALPVFLICNPAAHQIFKKSCGCGRIFKKLRQQPLDSDSPSFSCSIPRMAPILASQCCCCHINHGRPGYNLGFSRSLANYKKPRLHNDAKNLVKSRKLHRFQVAMQQREVPAKVSRYVRDIKMVPTSEIKKRMSQSISSSENVNGSAKNVNGVSIDLGSGRSLVKRDPPPLIPKLSKPKELPPIEGPKVLPSDEGFSWANENYSFIQRTIDVWSSIISLRIRLLLDNAKWTYIGGFSKDKQGERRQQTASWLRERVLQLGPTFIKLGQMCSTRSDIFPKEFINELVKLQDKVPAFSTIRAIGLIEKELGAPVHILFKEFEDLPIAAASLGQVHRAILHNGEKVVVKVQRPGLKKLFDIDLQNLKIVAEYFQRNQTLGGKDWIGIYEECCRILYEEIDYVNEAKNADRFRRDFRNIKWVRIPMVFWDHTAVKVLTLEYVPGIKIDQLDMIDARGYNRSKISSRAVEAYLIQILKTGFFHADPHPGNLAIDRDEALIYYDFGMMGDIKSFTREKLLQLFYAAYEKDAKKVIQCLVNLGALEPTGDHTSVRRSVQFFLDNSIDRPNPEQTLSAIGEDLFAMVADQPFRLPSTFTFVLRAFSTLEGIGYNLDPNFSFINIAAPYAQELLNVRQQHMTGTQVFQELSKQADDARSYTVSMPYRIQKIEDIAKQLESGELKLRVRVLESERAAKKATRLHMGTIYTVLGGTLVNLSMTLINQGNQLVAYGSFFGGAVFLVLFVRSMQKVKELDKIEKMI